LSSSRFVGMGAACAAVAVGGLLLSGCGGAAGSSAMANGYGTASQAMIHAHLKPGAPADAGPRLSQQWISNPSVVFTNWTEADGLTIGLTSASKVADIESWLKADPAIQDVSAGPVPTAPPAGDRTDPDLHVL